MFIIAKQLLLRDAKYLKKIRFSCYILQFVLMRISFAETKIKQHFQLFFYFLASATERDIATLFSHVYDVRNLDF